MDINDQRDYAEEAANQALMLEEQEEEDTTETVYQVNYHNTDRGTWCRWSMCVVNAGKTRCPDQCKESRVMVVGSQQHN